LSSASQAQNPIIGVRDSGVGGLTVARQIKQRLPHARLLYFADTAHVPYGDRAPEEVKYFALNISEFLLSQGAQALVFACNTSSAYALETARERFEVPVFGMIEPGARAALAITQSQRIGVLATQATVDSAVYAHTIQRLQPTALVVEMACPHFVPLVENEQTQSSEAYTAARKYLEPLQEAAVDTVILGCTHYPLLLPVLCELAPHLHWVDPAETIAQDIAAQVGSGQVGSDTATKYFEEDIFFVSGPQDGVKNWIPKLLPHSNLNVQAGPVFDTALR
jgi:glutamate racemase